MDQKRESTNTYVLLHGYQGGPSKNFFPWLKKELKHKGASVYVPNLPNPHDPKVAEQTAKVLNKIPFDKNTILVGHSLGGVVAMKVLENLKQPVKKTVLVNSFTENKFLDEPFKQHSFDWKFDADKIRANAGELHILRDLTDDTVPYFQADNLKKLFGGTIYDYSARSPHTSGKKEPELLQHLAELKPTRGLYLVEPHAQWTAEGKKQVIVKGKKYNMSDEPMYLLGRKNYGVLQLGNRREIDWKEFERLRKKHLISKEEQMKWWPNHKLYAYDVTNLKTFRTPKGYDYPKGAQAFVKMAAYAPGIPSREIKESPRTIKTPTIWGLAIQEHKAKRAGLHYDIRIVDDKTGKAYSWASRYLPTNPGDKVLATLQPTHTAEYATWEGTIDEGYGAGKVRVFDQDKIEVTKSQPGEVLFNRYKTNGETERYAMINTGGDKWLFYNVTPTRITRPEIPAEKPSYKSIPIDKVNINDPNLFLSPKIDGALNAFVLRPYKPIEVYSYRPSKKKTALVDHTFRSPTYKTIVPPEMRGTNVVLGELFAKDESGRVLPSTETSARLLSNVWRSRELQQKAPLDNIVYNVLRYQGKDVSNKPYNEKLEILRSITKQLPDLKMPPIATTPEEKEQLISSIRAHRNPLTHEGVVIYDLNKSVPLKSKFREDYDVYVRDVFPGEGKYTGNAAGGFTYSFTPKGKVIGRVGTGINDQLRRQLWKNPESYRGQVARIFAQEQLPSGALRMPVFKDFRSEKWK